MILTRRLTKFNKPHRAGREENLGAKSTGRGSLQDDRLRINISGVAGAARNITLDTKTRTRGMKILRLSDCQRKKYPEGEQFPSADREFLFPFLLHLLLLLFLAPPRKARFAIHFNPSVFNIYTTPKSKTLPEIHATCKKKEFQMYETTTVLVFPFFYSGSSEKCIDWPLNG